MTNRAWFLILFVVAFATNLLPISTLGQKETLQDLLPTAGSIGFDMVVSDEGTRNLEEIAQSFPDHVAAERALMGWGWDGNACRTFTRHGGPAWAPASIEVSLHRFRLAQDAQAALPHFAISRAEAFDLQPVTVASRYNAAAITGPVEGGTEVTV